MRLRVMDDAGKRVTLQSALEYLKPEQGPRLGIQSRRIVRAMSPPYAALLGAIGIALSLGPLAWPLALSFMGRNPRGIDGVLMAAGWVLALLIMWTSMILNRPRAARIFADGMLEEGICPSCGYNFAGLERSGLLICPECGAGWNSGRICRAVVDPPLPPVSEIDRAFRQVTLRIARDDRDRLTAQQGYALRAALRWAVDEGHTARLRSVRRTIARRGRIARVLSGTFLVAAFALVLNLLSPILDERTLLGSFMVGAVIAPIVWFGSFGRGSRRHIRTAFKRAGLCPSCGGDLSRVAPEHDGCRVCPVCRSAWRIEKP